MTELTDFLETAVTALEAIGVHVYNRSYESVHSIIGTKKPEYLCVSYDSFNVIEQLDRNSIIIGEYSVAVDVCVEKVLPHTRVLELIREVMRVARTLRIGNQYVNVEGWSREEAETTTTARYKVTITFQQSEVYE